MSRDSVGRAIPAGDRVLLDTATLVAYFDGTEPVSPLAAYLIDDFVRSGRNVAIVSMITAMEVLVRPLRHWSAVYPRVVDFLRSFPNLRAMAVDLVVAQEAATQRAAHNFSTPDALIVGTGLVAQVGHLITNDADWKSKLRSQSSRVKVCYLQDHLPFP